jgi:superfamily I DNA and/or RNA helicase
MTIQLIKYIMEVAGNGRLEPLKGKIGVVTPYKAQVKILQDEIRAWIRRVSNCDPLDIEINSVDSYQGREKEIMIFSCVRNNEIKNIR